MPNQKPLTGPHNPAFSLKSIKVPQMPGVYRFFDGDGTILYIGKAKDIKKRLQQHFQGAKNAPAKNRKMIEQVADVQWTTTDNEVEALVLENLLIKEHQPKYNILLRDDKNFLYVKVTHEPFPDILLVRRITDRKGTYFGPYTSAGAVRTGLDLLERLFPYRCLTFRKKGATGVPCFNYHIGRCPGLCLGTVAPEEYAKTIMAITAYLKGDTSLAEKTLEERMKKEAAEKRFEQAAKTRNLLMDVRDSDQRQKVLDPNQRMDRDVFGTHRRGKSLFVSVYNIRNGKLMGQTKLSLSLGDGAEDDAIVTERLLTTYYDMAAHIPREVLVEALPTGIENLVTWLEGKRGAKVEILVPERGTKAQFLKMANRDAETYARRDEVQEAQKSKFDPEKAAAELGATLGLKATPKRIECYDISHISGKHTVASMVVFIDGKPSKKNYRHFKIATIGDDIDDFRSMEETLGRRLRHILHPTEEEKAKGESLIQCPDLLILDGGKGQLGRGVKVLKNLGLTERIPIVSLAKENEDIFRPGKSFPLQLDKHSSAQYLVEQLRDESHRFANSFNRRLRLKSDVASEADAVKGIGPVKRKALIKEFGSLAEARKADSLHLEKILGKKVAEAFLAG